MAISFGRFFRGHGVGGEKLQGPTSKLQRSFKLRDA